MWLKLARDRETGKSRGYAWLKYEDQRSTDLAVDNLGGATVLERMLVVDHTRYKKRDDENDEEFNIEIPKVANGAADVSGTNVGSGGDSEEDDRRRALRDAITQEHEEEDPMKEYLARERKEKRKLRHHSKERKSREHRHHHHRRHRHHSRER